MPTNHEVQRMIDVFRRYRESEVIQAQWSEANLGNRAIMRERIHAMGKVLSEVGYVPLTERRVLEVGCGSGKVLAMLLRWGASPDKLYGIDLVPERIEDAKQRFPEINFLLANAENLNFPDGSFDLVLQFTVFTAILDDEMAHNVAAEICRVLKPGGALLWYDFRYNNPWNRNVRGMTKEAIRALFPAFDLHLHTVTLLPPLARRLHRTTSILYPVLARIPFLRTHYVGLLLKRQ
jgi:ubiquinone/menaquinone biosynthesis C-methylase UbiE